MPLIPGLLIPVKLTDSWCATVDRIDNGRGFLSLNVIGGYWRRSGEVWPAPALQQPGTPVYLLHSTAPYRVQSQDRGQFPMTVRCRLTILESRFVASWGHPNPLLRLMLDTRQVRPVRTEWDYGAELHRGWRYVNWTPECEHPFPDWRGHAPHDGCDGMGGPPAAVSKLPRHAARVLIDDHKPSVETDLDYWLAAFGAAEAGARVAS